jgi:hypothetical protein
MKRSVLQKLRTGPFSPGVRNFAQVGVEFRHQPGFADPRFAGDQHQLPFALPRPLPAPVEHGDFLVATNERGKVTLSRAAAGTACPDDAVERYWLGHALELMPA